jgi:hypothetical protein
VDIVEVEQLKQRIEDSFEDQVRGGGTYRITALVQLSR